MHRFLLFALLACATSYAQTSHWPAQDGNYVIQNFHFGSGESIPELKLHYLTLGKPHRDAAGHTDNVVLLLHGTGGDAHSLLNPVFSDVLFGPGQPLDITKFYIILPDDIGHGESSKPSDGLRMHFPQYDYDDMVNSQHTMLVDGLHVDHLRLILGTSMGCMQSFVWGETYPNFSDALAPFACLPVELAGRNRMWRYMAMQMIRDDPAWKNGDYTTEPIEGLRGANDLILIAGSAPLPMQKRYPTRVLAEGYVDRTLDSMIAHSDANDFLYYVNASRNYNPERSSAPSLLPCYGSTPPMTSSIRRSSVSRRRWLPGCHTRSSSLFRLRRRLTDTAPTRRQPSGRITWLRFSRRLRRSENGLIQGECVEGVTASGDQILMSIQQIGLGPISHGTQHRKMP
jgi:homoserine O-acetyltransferase